MKNILIDSNIYLNFYRTNLPNYKKLIEFLLQIKDQIFVSKQIVDEVNRNKAIVFAQTFQNYINVCNLEKITILPQYDGETDKIADWNKEYKDVIEKLNQSKKELKNIQAELFDAIVESEDNISKDIDKIMDNSFDFSLEVLERAQRRKLLGNPPGKNRDPLGDQLIWEQYLEYLKNNKKDIKEIVIISNDDDYFVSINNDKRKLNPLLMNEIHEIFDRNVNLYCYNDITSFLLDPKFGNMYSEDQKSKSIIEAAKVELGVLMNKELNIGSFNRVRDERNLFLYIKVKSESSAKVDEFAQRLKNIFEKDRQLIEYNVTEDYQQELFTVVLYTRDSEMLFNITQEYIVEIVEKCNLDKLDIEYMGYSYYFT